jgi:hypothetical protein
MLILGSDDVNYLGTLLVLLGLGAGLYAAGAFLELAARPEPITDDDLVSEFANLVIAFNAKEGKSDAAD